ncbi:MAG: YceI family protein, partial [Dokdonella sp.]
METFQIDSVRSHAEFSLRAVLLMTVRGEFGMVGGTVRINREEDIGWVDARIDARAVEMNSDEREDWARSAEFFDSSNHPQIRF